MLPSLSPVDLGDAVGRRYSIVLPQADARNPTGRLRGEQPPGTLRRITYLLVKITPSRRGCGPEADDRRAA